MNTQGVDDAAREYYGLPDAFGVLIERVTEDGPADEAGLQRNDIIRKVDGTVVRDNLDLISKIASRQPGDTVKLEVLRDGKPKTIKVVLWRSRRWAPRRRGSADSRATGSRPARIAGARLHRGGPQPDDPRAAAPR